MTMPLACAGDPAPQQLTAPCRKYSGRSHPPIEQVVYRSFSWAFFVFVARGRVTVPSRRLRFWQKGPAADDRRADVLDDVTTDTLDTFDECSIDLNCDLGESFGRWTLGQDAALMASISSCNIACGFHAGDPEVMRRTVRLAREHGVAVGAHPGLPDLVGFGRRTMSVSPQEVEDIVLYQIGALAAIAGAEGVRLQHVKPHGALYNMAIRQTARSPQAIARAVGGVRSGLAGSSACPEPSSLRAGEAAGLRVAAEGLRGSVLRA